MQSKLGLNSSQKGGGIEWEKKQWLSEMCLEDSSFLLALWERVKWHVQIQAVNCTIFLNVASSTSGNVTCSPFFRLLHVVTCIFQLLSDAGFMDVIADDRSKQFVAVLEREIAKATGSRDELVKVSVLVAENCWLWLSSAELSWTASYHS